MRKFILVSILYLNVTNTTLCPSGPGAAIIGMEHCPTRSEHCPMFDILSYMRQRAAIIGMGQRTTRNVHCNTYPIVHRTTSNAHSPLSFAQRTWRAERGTMPAGPCTLLDRDIKKGPCGPLVSRCWEVRVVGGFGGRRRCRCSIGDGVWLGGRERSAC